jgi:peptide/nickel transport system permease protein
MRLFQNRAAVAGILGLLIVVSIIAACCLAPLLAYHGYNDPVGDVWSAPDAASPLGADNLGRDMASRLLYGGRTTIGIAFASTALAFIAGCGIGVAVGIRGGWVDTVVSRAVDIEMSLPSLIFVMVVLTIAGSSVPVLILTMAIPTSTRIFRLSRSLAREVAALDFFEAARMRRESLAWLMCREILPNIAGPLATDFGQRLCGNVLLIAALSFLGLGIQPPMADWGSMVRENAAVIAFGGLAPLFPAAAIALLAVGVNLITDWGVAILARQDD